MSWIKLNQLRRNQTGSIIQVNLDLVTKSRLFALGLINNATIKFIRRAPLGDPLEYLVSNNLVVLRENTARQIIIELV